MFKKVEPREVGDLIYRIVEGAGAFVILEQETNEFQRDVLILNHIEAIALRDWLNAALDKQP